MPCCAKKTWNKGHSITASLETTAVVCEQEIYPEPPPSCLSLDETGAGQIASRLIRELDKHFDREQVHLIARWMRYLSTQQ